MWRMWFNLDRGLLYDLIIGSIDLKLIREN